MEVTKQAQGSNIKTLKFEANISCTVEKDRAVFNQCLNWRRLLDAAELCRAEMAPNVTEGDE